MVRAKDQCVEVAAAALARKLTSSEASELFVARQIPSAVVARRIARSYSDIEGLNDRGLAPSKMERAWIPSRTC
jgi:hypothetical protein